MGPAAPERATMDRTRLLYAELCAYATTRSTAAASGPVSSRR